MPKQRSNSAILRERKRYERLATRTRRFSEAWDDFAREFNVAALNLDPDEIFSGVRNDDHGRDVGL